jgi:hypothetical protein
VKLYRTSTFFAAPDSAAKHVEVRKKKMEIAVEQRTNVADALEYLE